MCVNNNNNNNNNKQQIIFQQYLQKGEVLIFVESCYNSVNVKTRIDYIEQGKCLGQQSFFMNERFPFRAQTQQWCNIYRISRIKFVDVIRQHQKDFELFHLIISKRYRDPYEFYTKLDLKCFTCMSESHQADTCDVTHYYKSNLVFKINVRDDKLKREQFERKRKKQYKSVLIQHQIKRIAQDFMIRMKSTKFRKQFSLDSSFEDSDEDDFYQQQQYQNEIGEIRQMLGDILKELGEDINFYQQQQVKLFIPERPQFDPFEQSFCIDEVKNYEHFYPKYNLINIINNIF